jgi:hypothetical protein
MDDQELRTIIENGGFEIEDAELAYEMKRFDINNEVAIATDVEIPKGLNGGSPLNCCYEFENTEDLEHQVNNRIVNDVWRELADIVKVLESVDYRTARDYINIHLTSEKEELKELFKNDFKHIKNEDPLKLKVLEVLGKLGITITEFRD